MPKAAAPMPAQNRERLTSADMREGTGLARTGLFGSGDRQVGVGNGEGPYLLPALENRKLLYIALVFRPPFALPGVDGQRGIGMGIGDQNAVLVVDLDLHAGHRPCPLQEFLQARMASVPVLSAGVVIGYKPPHPLHLGRIPIPLEAISLLVGHHAGGQPISERATAKARTNPKANRKWRLENRRERKPGIGITCR